MASEWRQLTWGDLASLEYGKGLRGHERGRGASRVYGTNGPIGWTSEPLCDHPTVIVGRKGAYRGVHYSSDPCFVIDTAFYLEPRVSFDMRWAYYELLTHDINSLDSGSAIPSTSRESFYCLPVLVPPPPVQREIAGILGAFDDKIELNRRMNKTLEAMARALFKCWFVDFEPVRLKAKGIDPSLPPAKGGLGLDPEISALFPDSFVDSELGEIPKGWEVGTLKHVAENSRRGVQPEELDPSTPYIGLEHMPRCCIALSQWGRVEELKSNKFEFERGEVLFGKLRPYFHKVGVAAVNGVCSTDILVVIPKHPDWFGFVLGHVAGAEFVNYVSAGSTGTKMPRTKWADMARYEVVLPPKSLATAFTRQIRQIVERIIATIHESITLAALRDALLPKLISGEVSIEDAKKSLEEESGR